MLKTHTVAFQLQGKDEIDLFDSALSKIVKQHKDIGFKDKLLTTKEFLLIKQISEQLKK